MCLTPFSLVQQGPFPWATILQGASPCSCMRSAVGCAVDVSSAVLLSVGCAWGSLLQWLEHLLPSISDLAGHSAVSSHFFLHCQCSNLPLCFKYFHRGTPSWVAGLSCALWWGHCGTIQNRPCPHRGCPCGTRYELSDRTCPGAEVVGAGGCPSPPVEQAG